jgi:serine protease Do
VLGELVGVNVAIRAGAQNIGFALPIDFCISRAAELMGPKRRGGMRHGLIVRDSFARESTEKFLVRSVVVEMVEPGSPAAESGVQIGDVIEQVDDIAVRTSIDVERGFLDRNAGVKVPVKLTRGNATVAVEIALQPSMRAPMSAADTVWRRLGLKMQPVGAEVVAKANAQLHGGLLVTELVPGGVAASAGIQKGDVLVGLHQWETLSVDNVSFVLNHKDYASFLPLKFYVARDGKLRDGWITGTP